MDNLTALADERTCTIPPEGWECTRPTGHEGPCAAVPTPWRDYMTGTAFSFEPGNLHITRDGKGLLGFPESGIETDGDGYVIATIPASELIALRDFLNLWLPTPGCAKAGAA